MTRFTVHGYGLELTSPFRIAYDTVTHSHNLLLVADRDGIVGHGEAGPVPTITGETVDEASVSFRRWFEQRTRGDVDTLGPQGLAPSLAHEVAVADVDAQMSDEPLCTFLSGNAPGPVPTSITIPLISPDEAEILAAAHRRSGFTIFKIKTGGGMDEDLQRIRRVREVVGDREIRVDANQGWSREETLAALPTLQDFGVDVLEQPLAKTDLEGHADLRGHGVPIMLDESVFSAQDARDAIAVGACDRINIKLQKTGGIREALAIATIAEAADIPCMIGCMIESRVGILAGAHTFAAHDNIHWADLDGHTFLREDPVSGGAIIEDGVITLRQDPGLGIKAVDGGRIIVSDTEDGPEVAA